MWSPWRQAIWGDGDRTFIIRDCPMSRTSPWLKQITRWSKSDVSKSAKPYSPFWIDCLLVLKADNPIHQDGNKCLTDRNNSVLLNIATLLNAFDWYDIFKSIICLFNRSKFRNLIPKTFYLLTVIYNVIYIFLLNTVLCIKILRLLKYAKLPDLRYIIIVDWAV